MTEKKTQDNETNVIAALSYVFILCFVPLLLAKDSAYAQHHAKQGLVLFIVEVLVMIIASVLVFIPIFGWIVNMVMYLFVIIMSIVGIVQALQGKKWEMPWLGSYAKKLKI